MYFFIGLGCFSNVDVQIDTAAEDRTSYEVTFKVNELKRLSGAVNTMMGNQEGSVSLGLKSPNVFGRGEKFQMDYSYGTKKTNQFNISLSKPLHDMKTQKVAPNLSLNAFQQIGELPWSAYKEMNRGLLLDLAFLSAPQVWQYRLWSFHGRDTKLERFLAKNQLYSNEITKF